MKELKFRTKAQKATAEDIFWRDEQRKLTASGPELMDKTAQTTLTALSLLTALYIAALSGLEILKQGALWLKIVSLFPIVVFAAAIFVAFVAIFPKSRVLEQDAPDKTKEFIINLTRKKKRLLITAAALMIFGVVSVIGVFVLHFYLIQR
jgi:hypothetical protein